MIHLKYHYSHPFSALKIGDRTIFMHAEGISDFAVTQTNQELFGLMCFGKLGYEPLLVGICMYYYRCIYIDISIYIYI